MNIVLEVHLVEHCNLKCANCTHFSPIAEREILNYREYEENLQKIKQDVLNSFEEIRLLGGEPLLNKDICSILSTTRKYFKKRIRLITNGICLGTMSDTFFQTLERDNIELAITKYPIKLNYELLMERIKSKYKSINIYIFHDTDLFGVHKFDLEGKQNIEKNYRFCEFTTNLHCTQLVGTKLHICTFSAYIRHFNKKFNKKIEEDSEYIDLSKVSTFEEVSKWFDKPKRFCRYCIVKERVECIPWKLYQPNNNDYL